MLEIVLRIIVLVMMIDYLRLKYDQMEKARRDFLKAKKEYDRAKNIKYHQQGN